MEVAAGRGGVVPVPSPQAARKEWRALPEHSFRSNGDEEQEHVKLGQSAERTIHEVGPGPHEGNFCLLTIDDGGELNDNVLQQRLQEVTRQREELQKIEIELQARRVARSEVLELQNSYEVQLKEHRDINDNLKEKLHEREQHIVELERKLEEKDRELRAMKIDTEAAWAKEDLLREQNKELATFRRERDNSEAERTQNLSKIRDLQEHIQEKESQFLSLQEQHRVAQETVLFKDEQLREAQSWIARVQEMDVLQSSTNQSLQAELRERTEQFNQYWLGFQRQFVEMERHHLQAIQQLQLELAEAREKNGIYKDAPRVTPETSMDSSYNGNQISSKDGGKSNGHLGFTSNGSVEGTSSYASASDQSSKTEHVPGVTVVPSSIIGMNGFIAPGQLAPLHSYVVNPLSIQLAVASTNSPLPQSIMEHYQSMPAVQNQQHWQNPQIPNQSKHSIPQAQQDLLGSNAHYRFNLPGEIQSVRPEHLNSQRDQKQNSGHPGSDSREEVKVLESNVKQSSVTQQPQETTLDAPHLDSAREYDPPEKKNENKTEDTVPAWNQSQEQILKSGQQWPTSSNMLSTSQNLVANDTAESTVFVAPVSSSLMSGKPPVEPNLLDERSLLSCIVRAIPAGSDGRIRISTTLPNRLGKMLAPLHWHDYKKHYGRLDDFVSRHPELFVIEGDFIHLREGAQQIISATAAFAKVAAAAAAVPYSSLLPSVAVTPVAQVNRQKTTQTIESKAVNAIPCTDGPVVTNVEDSSDKNTHILARQDEQLNGTTFDIIQGLSDVTISNKLKNAQEANGLPSEIKPGHSSVYFTVGNAANLDRTSLSPLQNKGLSNGRLNFVAKQQGRASGAGLLAKR